jgi:repressor LexA
MTMARGDTGAAILAWLRLYTAEHGYAPSVREICAALGLRSTATVHYHLRNLAEKGLISMEPGRKRAISVPSAAARKQESAPPLRKESRQREDRRTVPLVGTVAAGQPILAAENIEGYLPWDGGEGWFALRVKGWSMKNAGILPGDKLIVRPQPTAEHGEIVVALLGDEATVKRLSLRDGEIRLMPENEDFAPIDGSEAVILGVVRGVIREYG